MNAPLPTEVAVFQTPDCLPSILEALCALTNMPFAALAQMQGAQWRLRALQDGLSTGLVVHDVLNADLTFCQAVQASHAVLECPDVDPESLIDERHIGRRLEIRAYFACPVYSPEGTFFGTLFTADTKPSSGVAPGVVKAIETFGAIVGKALSQSHEGMRAAVSPPEQPAFQHDDTAAISRVLSVLGHDLRNPMHSLMAAIEMMRTKPLDPRAERLLGMIDGSAKRLGELAQLTLDFTKVRLLGHLPMQIEPTNDLQSRFESVIADIERHYPQRPIQSFFEGCAGVQCDAARLSQAFALVLLHAIKHAGAGQTVEIRSKSVLGEYFECTVRTPGHILDDALLPHIFDPFYQVDGESQTAQLGVGLYIAAQIASHHGGALTATQAASGDVMFELRIAQSPQI